MDKVQKSILFIQQPSSEPFRTYLIQWMIPTVRNRFDICVPSLLVGNHFRSISLRFVYRRFQHLSHSFINTSSPLLGPGRHFSFIILYTVSRTPRTEDRPFARPLLTHRIAAQSYPRIELDSNTPTQSSRE
jgi:hypothetical protein